MNEDLIAQAKATHAVMASFVRTAKNLAAASRAGARVAPAVRLGARENALARALRVLEVPARAASARGSGFAENPNAPQADGGAFTPLRPRTLAAAVAAASARYSQIAAGNGVRIGADDIALAAEGLDRRPSAQRSTMTRAIAAAQSGGAALSRVQQFTMHASPQSGAQNDARAARDGAFSEAAGSLALPRARNINLAASLTASRAFAPAQRNPAMARGAAHTKSGDRDPARAPSPIVALAALPARIRRVLVNSRSAAPAADFALDRARAETPRGRGPGFTAAGGRPIANTAAPITINSSPSITVNLPPGTAAPGERGISRAVAQALEEHAEKLYEMVRQVGAFRARAEF
ncbi:MAG: hypothetical protein ACYDC3_02280 [Candidatus Binataceae bacterium]